MKFLIMKVKINKIKEKTDSDIHVIKKIKDTS